MGKGKSSSSASDKRFYDNQRDGFRKIAENAEKSRTERGRKTAEIARAAEGLTGTERGRELAEDWNTAQIKTEMERAYDFVGAQSLSDLEKMLDNGTLNKPLGSGMSNTEWQGVKDAVQGYVENLGDKGYTTAEIAAAVAYGRYIAREGSGGGKASKLPRGVKAVTVTINGRKATYYEQNGMLMKADAVGTTRGTPVKSGGTLAQLYANAVEKGHEVETHSSSEVKAANALYAETRKKNAREIANAETSGTRQSKRISKQSGRVKSTRQR